MLIRETQVGVRKWEMGEGGGVGGCGVGGRAYLKPNNDASWEDSETRYEPTNRIETNIRTELFSTEQNYSSSLFLFHGAAREREVEMG